MAEVNLKELLESGAHFGHQTRRWNPKMGRFIYGARGGVHIIDLTKTAEKLEAAAKFAEEVTKAGGLILFVGTKRQAKAVVAAEAEAAGMPYVSERWLGGMLTNFRTIRAQIKRWQQLAEEFASGQIEQRYNKKEGLRLAAEAARLEHIFRGVRDLDGVPAALFVVDAPREDIAVAEARKLGIPVIAIADTNANPDLIDYLIPANDDAIKAVALITKVIAEAAAKGRSAYQADAAKAEAGEAKERANVG